jgi:hypothetical protein
MNYRIASISLQPVVRLKSAASVTNNKRYRSPASIHGCLRGLLSGAKGIIVRPDRYVFGGAKMRTDGARWQSNWFSTRAAP